MRTFIFIVFGLMCLMPHVLAADPQTNAPPKYYYTQGGRNDPFMNFATCPMVLEDALGRYDKLTSGSTVAERTRALNEVRLMAEVLIDKQPMFSEFFVRSHLPPQALAVSKPVFDALKNEKFQKELERFVPYLEQGYSQTLWFERMDIIYLRI